jgi:hypothetical protein
MAQAQEDDSKDVNTKGSAYSNSGSLPVNEGGVTVSVKKPSYYNLVLLSIIVFLSIPALLFAFANIIKSNPRYSFEECPRCKSIKLERMPKIYRDKFFSVLLVKSTLKRYQCLNCNWEGIKIVN